MLTAAEFADATGRNGLSRTDRFRFPSNNQSAPEPTAFYNTTLGWQ